MVERQHFSKTEDFVQAQNKFKHLREYVQRVSRTSGTPEFRVQLDRSLRDLENPNIIYPVGDPIFIHLFKGDGDNVKYTVIIPEMTEDEKDFYDAILGPLILCLLL